MARPLRLDFPGACHHVMNRGAKRKNVFFSNDHCSLFLDFAGEAVERFGIRIHGFALMPNHFHLMVESAHGNLSQAMSYLNGKYTQAVNRERGCDGALFRGRYHNRIVTDPSHWRYLLAYLHLNPVKARLVMKIDQWLWTSHRFYDGKYAPPDWLTTEKLTAELEGVEGYRLYLREVNQGRRETPDGFDRVLFGRRRSSEIQVVRQKESARELKPNSALKQVLNLSGSDRDEVFREVRGRGGNEVRTVAAWWLAVGSGLSNAEVAKRLKMSGVAVSRAIGRVRSEIMRNPTGNIANWAGILKQTREKVASRSA